MAAANQGPMWSVLGTLQQWLDGARLRYRITDFQRKYEWGELQVAGLLESINLVQDYHLNPTGNGQPLLKLSEIMVLCFRANNLDNVWGGRVDVIDGQQRITTMFIIYAVLQQCMFNLMANTAEEDGLAADIGNAVDRLKERFVGNDPTDREQALLQSPHLSAEVFNFDPRNSRLGEQLHAADEGVVLQETELVNAAYVYRWLHRKLADQRLTNSRAKFVWLSKLQTTLDKHVYWTTTFTNHLGVALHSFVGFNRQSSMACLKAADIIKVVMLLGTPHQRLASLEYWRSCERQITTVGDRLSSSGMLEWLRALSSHRQALADAEGSSRVQLEDPLFEDALKHVRAINLAADGMECKLEWKDSDLVQHFCENHLGRLPDLLDHICTYATLLTGIWYYRYEDKSRRFHIRLTTAQQQRLNELLAVPIPDWRPFMMELLRVLTTGNLPREFNKTELVSRALCDVECIIFCLLLFALELPPCMLGNSRKILAAGREAFGDLLRLELPQLLGDMHRNRHHLRDTGLRRVYNRMNWPMDGYPWQKAVLRSLFFCKLYKRSGWEARAVLIAVDNQLQWLAAEGGGPVATWTGSMSVEHILPQDSIRKPMEHPGFYPDGNLANPHLLHRVGNLLLLTKKANSKLQNKPYLGPQGKFAKMKQAGMLSASSLAQLREFADGDNDQDWTPTAMLQRQRRLVELFAERLSIEIPMAAEFDEWEQVLRNAAVEPENPPVEEAAGPAAAVAGGEEADEQPAEAAADSSDDGEEGEQEMAYRDSLLWRRLDINHPCPIKISCKPQGAPQAITGLFLGGQSGKHHMQQALVRCSGNACCSPTARHHLAIYSNRFGSVFTFRGFLQHAGYEAVDGRWAGARVKIVDQPKQTLAEYVKERNKDLAVAFSPGQKLRLVRPLPNQNGDQLVKGTVVVAVYEQFDPRHSRHRVRIGSCSQLADLSVELLLPVPKLQEFLQTPAVLRPPPEPPASVPEGADLQKDGVSAVPAPPVHEGAAGRAQVPRSTWSPYPAGSCRFVVCISANAYKDKRISIPRATIPAFRLLPLDELDVHDLDPGSNARWTWKVDTKYISSLRKFLHEKQAQAGDLLVVSISQEAGLDVRATVWRRGSEEAREYFASMGSSEQNGLDGDGSGSQPNDGDASAAGGSGAAAPGGSSGAGGGSGDTAPDGGNKPGEGTKRRAEEQPPFPPV